LRLERASKEFETKKQNMGGIILEDSKQIIEMIACGIG
jgi:hypothetical protein